MFRIVYIFCFSILFTGCELITIGTKSETKVFDFFDYNQKSSLGAIYLFKTELDSNNVSAASDLIAQKDGTKLLAIERYEKYFDIYRIKRMITMNEITEVDADTLSSVKLKYNMEFGYRRLISFTALKIENSWFITEMGNYE